MKTIEDLQLENELQELHLVTKYWISNLEFYKSELNFFQKLSLRYVGADKEKMKTLKTLVQRTAVLKEEITETEDALAAHLKVIDPLMINPQEKITILFLNRHLDIEQEVSDLFAHYKIVRQEVLDFADQSIAARCFEQNMNINPS